MSNFRDTVEKIKNLEAEKNKLISQIEDLKKIANARANALESEVSLLRDEVKSIKSIINDTETVMPQGIQQ